MLPPRIDPRTDKFVASRYIDYDIAAAYMVWTVNVARMEAEYSLDHS